VNESTIDEGAEALELTGSSTGLEGSQLGSSVCASDDLNLFRTKQRVVESKMGCALLRMGNALDELGYIVTWRCCAEDVLNHALVLNTKEFVIPLTKMAAQTLALDPNFTI
jgi:hypothetical protein